MAGVVLAEPPVRSGEPVSRQVGSGLSRLGRRPQEVAALLRSLPKASES